MHSARALEIYDSLGDLEDKAMVLNNLGMFAYWAGRWDEAVGLYREAAGLAERQPDQADGRSSFAALTPAGREALRRAWPVYRQAIYRQLTARLSPRQCRELAALLGLVIATDDLDPPVTISR